MAEWLWIDGRVQPMGQPALSGLDRGFLLGEGVYETMVFRNGRLWKPHLHARRMAEGLAGLSIPLTVTEAVLDGILQDLLRHEGLLDGILRVTATSGPGGRGLLPAHQAPPTLSAFADPLPDHDPTPLTAIVSTVRRNAGTPRRRYHLRRRSWPPPTSSPRPPVTACPRPRA